MSGGGGAWLGAGLGALSLYLLWVCEGPHVRDTLVHSVFTQHCEFTELVSPVVWGCISSGDVPDEILDSICLRTETSAL